MTLTYEVIGNNGQLLADVTVHDDAGNEVLRQRLHPEVEEERTGFAESLARRGAQPEDVSAVLVKLQEDAPKLRAEKPVSNFPLSDVGAAERVWHRHGHDVRHSPELGGFVAWD